LDNATIDNGCLWVIPRSHQPGVIYPQRPHNDSRFDVAGEGMQKYLSVSACVVTPLFLYKLSGIPGARQMLFRLS